MQIRDFPTIYGDIRYYWKLHCNKMKAKGMNHVTYPAFVNRLRRMNLHDAIESPRVDSQVRTRMYNKTPIQDNIRRTQVLHDENIQILTFNEIQKVENITFKSHKTKDMAKYNMKPKKKSIRSRFISLFKR